MILQYNAFFRETQQKKWKGGYLKSPYLTLCTEGYRPTLANWMHLLKIKCYKNNSQSVFQLAILTILLQDFEYFQIQYDRMYFRENKLPEGDYNFQQNHNFLIFIQLCSNLQHALSAFLIFLFPFRVVCYMHYGRIFLSGDCRCHGNSDLVTSGKTLWNCFLS